MHTATSINTAHCTLTASTWRSKPKVDTHAPLFSLLEFIRNAKSHLGQMIKAQINWFFHSKFPWLARVLQTFVQIGLRQAINNPNINNCLRASMINIVRTSAVQIGG